MTHSTPHALADFVESVSFDALPAEVVLESKRILLDSVGCAIGGIDHVLRHAMVGNRQKPGRAANGIYLERQHLSAIGTGRFEGSEADDGKA